MNRTDRDWTVLDLLHWAAADFEAKQLEAPRRSAEVLLGHALGTDRVGLYLQYNRTVETPERDRFRDLVARRRAGMPVAYLVGEKEFYSLPFQVDDRVLVPRPETELLVDETLEVLRARAGPEAPRVCDVGTGCGAIAVAVKKALPGARVTASDTDPRALEVARANAARHQAEIEFVRSDLLEGVRGPFDVIVANLPYVLTSDVRGLPVEVRGFEPRAAYEGGEDGLKWIRPLIRTARGFLTEGHLLLEIGKGHVEPVSQLLSENGFEVRAVRKDLAGQPRVVVGKAR